MPRTLLLMLVVLSLLALRQWSQRPIEHAPGVLVAEAPQQRSLASGEALPLEEFSLTKRAQFGLRARVLAKERYWLGTEARLSPVDLALGWGPMSDQQVLDRVDVSQANRWYFTRYKRPAPLQDQAIIRHSANMHIIPADSDVEGDVLALRHGDLVRLEGFLVDVDSDGGFRWRTSLRRDDTGAGSCEIFYVEDILREARP